MKHLLSGLLLLSLGIFGCSSQKRLTTDPPFTVSQAVCNTWVGGREESGKGMEVSLLIEDLKREDVVLQELYFRGRVGELSQSTEEEGIRATCNFVEPSKEISMHSDPMKEVGNQPPRVKSKEEQAFAFELSAQEAVISYSIGDQMKYYKIAEIVEKPARVYRGREEQ